MTRYQEFLAQVERQDPLEHCTHTDLVRAAANGKFYCPICEDPLEDCFHKELVLGLDGKFYCPICEPVKGETDGTESTNTIDSSRS